MKPKFVIAVTLVAGPLLWASVANADLINMGASSDTMTFTGNGDGTLNFSTTGFNFTGRTSSPPLVTSCSQEPRRLLRCRGRLGSKVTASSQSPRVGWTPFPSPTAPT